MRSVARRAPRTAAREEHDQVAQPPSDRERRRCLGGEAKQHPDAQETRFLQARRARHQEAGGSDGLDHRLHPQRIPDAERRADRPRRHPDLQRTGHPTGGLPQEAQQHRPPGAPQPPRRTVDPRRARLQRAEPSGRDHDQRRCGTAQLAGPLR
jgi:hypothetical protein